MQDLINAGKKFDVIYADPPWSYKRVGKCAKGDPGKFYKTMDINDIKSMPVSEIASRKCALFLWGTSPLLDQCLDTAKAWGFEYKNIAFTWTKLNKHKKTPWMGLGSYTRANNEFCLLATKGNVAPWRIDRGVHSVIQEPLREHSRKPDRVRDDIVRLFGDRPRIELFARTSTPGWEVWGNETDKF